MNTKGYWERIRRFCIAAVICSAVLSGCSEAEQKSYEEIAARYRLENTHTVCHDGYKFVVFERDRGAGITQFFGDDGKPKKCER